MAPSVVGGRLPPAQREIFGFRTHKPVVNIPAIGDVKDARGENRPPLVVTRAPFNAGRLCTAGAEHEKRERALAALPSREMARTGSGDIGSCNQIQSHPVGRATVCVRVAASRDHLRRSRYPGAGYPFSSFSPRLLAQQRQRSQDRAVVWPPMPASKTTAASRPASRTLPRWQTAPSSPARRTPLG